MEMQALTLHNNVGVNGTIPTFLGDFSKLRVLTLFNTAMSGSIPSELGKLDQLQTLFLHNADFVGTMPQEICDLRTFDEGLDGKNLQRLTADCAEPNPKVVCPQPSCCTGCF